MISKDDIQNLANLARIDVAENEIEGIRQKMEGILDYVSEVQALSKEEASFETPDSGENRNAFREDAEPHEEGKYTESLIRNAPHKEGNYLKVKKIL